MYWKRFGQERLCDWKYPPVSEPYAGEAGKSSGIGRRKAGTNAKAAAEKALEDNDALLFAVRDVAPKWAKQEL